jgi:hypothetical protein
MDNNKMIHIVKGLETGEKVLLNPPIKSTIGELQTPAGIAGQAAEDLETRIADQLSKANGNLEITNPPAADANDTSQRERLRERFQNLSDEEREAMRKRFQEMSPEQRQKLREQFGRPGARRPRPGQQPGDSR